jgi:hypothetical protein
MRFWRFNWVTEGQGLWSHQRLGLFDVRLKSEKMPTCPLYNPGLVCPRGPTLKTRVLAKPSNFAAKQRVVTRNKTCIENSSINPLPFLFACFENDP